MKEGRKAAVTITEEEDGQYSLDVKFFPNAADAGYCALFAMIAFRAVQQAIERGDYEG